MNDVNKKEHLDVEGLMEEVASKIGYCQRYAAPADREDPRSEESG